MSLAERRRLRLFTLCVLYVAQGIPWGFMATTLPAYLAKHGVTREALGTALAMTTLPYGFKWVWGPLVDAFTIPSLGRRRPWILFAQAMMAATVIAMVLIPDISVDLQMLSWMILIHTVFNSLQDVSTDALAVDLLDDNERGRANGLMYASKYFGGIIGGVGMATIIAYSDLSTALIVQTAILVAIMAVPFLIRERPAGTAAPRPPLGDVLRGLAEAFSIRSAVITAILMIGVNLASGILTTTSYALFTQRLGWEAEELTALTGGLGLAAGFGGSILGGFLADVFGRRRMILIAGAGMAANWLVFAMAEPYWSNDVFAYVLAILEVLTQSIMTVSLFALCMDVSWTKIGASQFTAYMALANFSQTIGFRLGSELAGWSYARIYMIASLIQLVMTTLVLAIDPTETRRRLPLPPGSSIVPGIIAAVALLVVLVTLMIVLVIIPFVS
ncbi:MAG: MFS transporter [Kofleriaceae bacterium]